MPDIVLILWLPAAIMFMSVAWVLTLGAIGQTPVVAEDRQFAATEES